MTNYQGIINSVAEEIDLPPNIVDRIYRAFWQSIRNRIECLPLKQDISQEEFNGLRTNFNIPALGKLCCTFERMQSVKKRFEYIKKLKND